MEYSVLGDFYNDHDYKWFGMRGMNANRFFDAKWDCCPDMWGN